MKIKICGLRETDDILSLGGAGADYLGFIFFQGSPRCAAYTLDAEILKLLPRTIRKTGVFVDASAEEILETAEQYGLDAIQLHGEETPEFCAALRERFRVIKAFRIGEDFDFDGQTSPYLESCDLFLFDAAGSNPGGNGLRYNWDMLMQYTNYLPFFVSGGIAAHHAADLLRLEHPQLYGCDINSRFEIYPGKKNVEHIKRFIRSVKPSAYELPGF
ncbi:MAG: phosphoribosylanthranilate isomerase [Bacteroidetes bacterium]|nr:MAG: phosphoribosylanthranilate isomerase [Bacteroidota bacterium]